ncbi:hypothetical protein [Runella sp.]|uniref:hypothetical protein n=1 Tax=Runella sp. TaxID=1960881 RepID=UPI003D13272A
MYTAIKGIYENGVLTMTETPPQVKKSEVVILFMNDSEAPKKGVKLGSLEDKYSIPDNFNEPLDDLKEYM